MRKDAISITLSKRALEHLDRMVGRYGSNRSAMLNRILEAGPVLVHHPERWEVICRGLPKKADINCKNWKFTQTEEMPEYARI
jgi:hypothetical protein